MRKFFALLGLSLFCCAPIAEAQRSGGVLRIEHRDSPASLSIHEEGTNSVVTPMMAVFSNLVIFDQHKKQNSLQTIVPELATSWTVTPDGKSMVFKLREGVKWHDGKPFTSADVKCTFDLLQGKAKDKFRLNFRAGWYTNLDRVEVNGDYQATFHLHRPQPSFIALLASGYTPIYPCHVPTATMRTHPVGTGPFRFVEFKHNESIRLERNPNYWKKGLPYLDAIEYGIITNRSTALLSFVSGRYDATFPHEMSIPLVKDIKAQRPDAICEIVTTNVSTNLLVNRDAPPFDNPEIRRAMGLTLDRKAYIDIMSEGQNSMGGAMLPGPEGVWGMPKEILETIPGYGPNVAKNRAEAQAIMKKLGYGPDNRLPLKVSTRNIASYRDAAVILIDQLNQIYFNAELEVVETAIWHSKISKKDYVVGLNLTGSGVDDPDQQFFENYACGSMRNYTHYCNKELDALVVRQSSETDIEKRKKMVWEIDRILQTDLARPIIMHNRAGSCWSPKVRNMTIMVNSIYNGWKFEDLWLEK